MLRRGVNAPRTSSAGRLFDAVAALIGLRAVTRYEGQAAMELEFAADGVSCDEGYGFEVRSPAAGNATGPLVLDWEPVVRGVLDDLERGMGRGKIAAKFHRALADGIVAVARRAGEERVVLTGGCFQNKTLTEAAVRQLRAAGFRPYWHQRVPPNDGGIAVGQALAAGRRGE